MRLKVLGEKVLIKPDPYEYQGLGERSAKALKEGLLVLPDAYEGVHLKLSPKGTVVRVGTGCKIPLKKGDRVLYAQFSFEKVEEKKDGMVLVHERDVHAIIEEE